MGQQWRSEHRFFHNIVLIRKHFNSISQISDYNGNVFNDHSSIEQAFIGFYSQLWTNSSNDNFVDILNALPDDLSKLSSDMCNFIT